DTTSPTYSTFYGNATSIYLGSAVKIDANWTDDFDLHEYIASWWNTTTWINASPYSLPDALSCGANCSEMTIEPDIVGTWKFKFFAEDESGNWAETGEWNTTMSLPPNRATLGYWQITPCLGGGAWQLGEKVNLTSIFTVSSHSGVYGDKITALAVINSTGNITYWEEWGMGTKNNGSIWNISWDSLPYTDSNQLILYYYSANATPTTRYFNISVAESGLLNSECYSNSSTVIPTTGGSSAFSDLFANFFNAISIPLTIFWVIIMLIIIIIIWFYFHGEPMLATIGTFGVSLLWTFLGLKVGVLNSAIFTLIMLIIIVSGGLTIWIAVKRHG
ncbi:MAG: hypothetical protein NTY03_05230, partial [Candidatus Bathyarchaeota archaeon]|nr:hypothetical protein [Candidatus Bathyarchaeota archaeon]